MTETPRFQKIDETNISDHSFLIADDQCYFLFEYTSHKDYTFSATNNLISNLKKKPSRKHLPEYRYKAQAIRRCSMWLSGAINAKWLDGATLVPVPPSKAKDHPEYDDRVLQIAGGIPAQFPVDVRELVLQKQSIEAFHESESRPTVAKLLELYELQEGNARPTPKRIGIVDDVLTVGTHFRAMHTLLSRRFPGIPIVGFFVARRVFPNDETMSADDLLNIVI